MRTQRCMRWLGLPTTRGFRVVLGAALLIGVGLSSCAPATQDNPVLAIVNGRPITLNEFDYRWSELPDSTRSRYESEGGKRQFLDELISRELLMQEARKLGLHRSPSIRHRAQRFEEKLLLDHVMQEVVKTKINVSQDELEAYYAEHGAVLPAPDRIEVSQIVSKNIYAAKDIRRMIGEGASFRTLAKLYSADAFTKSKGGEVGLYQKGMAPPEVEEVIYRLRPGRVSDPIKTESGFYIVMVTSRKPGDTKAVLAARKRLEQELYARKRQEHIKAYLSNLRATANVRMADASKYVTSTSSTLSVTSKP